MIRHFEFTFIDLFAGLGGFHQALSQLGGKCVFASELKEDLRKLYLHNFPEMEGKLPSGIKKVEGDITAIRPEDIPSHDVLCGGFPCQPFSQAGKRQGFNDEKDRGNLFNYICDILEYHKPKYLFLENVANLHGHDNGNTWKVISEKLEKLGYKIKDAILSPHEYGIPQHRKRIYICGIREDQGGIKGFDFPPRKKDAKCDIHKLIDVDDVNVIKLKPKTREQLEIWQEFINKTIESGDSIPRFPIWAMEFGATYEYDKDAPFLQSEKNLIGRKGHLGRIIENANSKEEILAQLPVYARTDKSREFPSWKKRYIQQNRAFYDRHAKDWLDDWIKKVANFDNSHLKMEWNCGDAEPILQDKIIQFRASGIRVKNATYAPALNLVGTQIPILPWVPLPKQILIEGEPDKGRYMTIKEAAAIQGMLKIDLDPTRPGFPMSTSRVFEALGNAVNVTVVKHIAEKLLSV